MTASDSWKMDPNTCLPQAGSDGIPEMLVTISELGHNQNDNGQVAAVGVSQASDAAGQVQTGGITYEYLQALRHDLSLPAFNGQLVLNDGINQNPPQNQLILPQLSLTASELNTLANALTGILGQRRVWMLYSQVRQDGTLVVVGFVVARVMQVQTTQVDDGDDQSHQAAFVHSPAQHVDHSHFRNGLHAARLRSAKPVQPVCLQGAAGGIVISH